MASSQHRCVFVGNIPYDATEEQLVQICEEVGPVVSFRLVIDRETGKPKGYGFCEYKDEETALSARRNLQGYEINGRQLRVDFAENDKGSDRNREQGRGGPGMAANVEPQKQVGGPAILGDAALHQPVGLPLAMAASSVMAGALGGAQAGSKSNQNGFQSQPMLGSDPLTLHLAKMSRNQLNEVISDLKVMATKNKESAKQLLLANPQLLKALFQSQIMLGMVTPQVLQMPNIRQASVPLPQPAAQDGQPVQQLAAQTLTGLPPLAQNKMQVGFMPKVQEGQATAMTHKPSIHTQFSALPQPPSQPQIQLASQGHNPALQQATFSGQSGLATLPSIRPQLPNNLSVRPQIQVGSSSSLKQQTQPPLLQHPGQIVSANSGHNSQLAIPNTTLRPTIMTHSSFPDPGFQPCSSTFSSIPETVNNNGDRSSHVTNNTYPNMPLGLPVRRRMADTSEPMNHPSKLVKLDDGWRAPHSTGSLNLSTSSASGPSQVVGIGSVSANQISKADEVQHMEKKVPQLAEVESTLLQQVLDLTPEQLSSLPPEQQQQVFELQKMIQKRSSF